MVAPLERRLLLFDIDGTLLNAGGVGRLAINRAFAREFGIPDALAGISLAGRCDQELFLELVTRHGLGDDSAVPRFLALYLAELEALFVEGLRPQVLPGVRQLLSCLCDDERMTLSLLTGNLEQGAWWKLGHSGLDGFFTFGAFGSDAFCRDDLVAVALERARKQTGLAWRAEDTVIIGDAPGDIRCARSNGVRVVAVATGPVGHAELQRLEPDALLTSLEDQDAFLAAVFGT